MTIITRGMGAIIKGARKKLNVSQKAKASAAKDKAIGKIKSAKRKAYKKKFGKEPTVIIRSPGGKTIKSKLVKDKTKSKAEQIFDNVYKFDKTGKKDKHISSMNKFLKDKKRSASPAMVDRYHAIMTSDPQVKPGKK